MSKITADHLARAAYVYIRQSTPEQVRHNLESKRRQYAWPIGLARSAGWTWSCWMRTWAVLDQV